VRLLLDTHLLLWATVEPERLSSRAQAVINDPGNQLLFSAASLWEMAIKQSRGPRHDFEIELRPFRQELLDNGYTELAVTADHALATQMLPPVHKDPFDRILVAQSIAEGITLLTSDRIVARYPGSVQRV
jgi:PIN domain nuclease of toxin-antitoxin system